MLLLLCAIARVCRAALSGTLTITPNATITITYGDSIGSLNGYSVSGYLTSAAGNDSATDSLTGGITGTSSYTVGSSVGVYSITYSGGTLASSLGYQFTYDAQAASITVGKKGLTVTASSHTITYGDAITAGSASYSGFIGVEDATVPSRHICCAIYKNWHDSSHVRDTIQEQEHPPPPASVSS